MMDIAILLYEGVTALDAVGAYEVLSRIPDARIRFVDREKGIKRTDTGFLFLMADHDFTEVTSADILLVPGSSTHTAIEMRDKATLEWVRTIDKTTRWTTSVCSGALILAAAGLLEDKPAATHWIARDMLKNFGAIPKSDRIVENGKMITAAGVSASIDMALYLAAKISGAEVAETIQLTIEYDPQPPFDAGSLEKASKRSIAAARKDLMLAAAKYA